MEKENNRINLLDSFSQSQIDMVTKDSFLLHNVKQVMNNNNISDGEYVFFILCMCYHNPCDANDRLLRRFGLNANKEKFNNVFNQLSKVTFLDCPERNKNHYETMYYKLHSLDDKIDYFLNRWTHDWKYYYYSDKKQNIYEVIFTEKERKSVDVASRIIEKNFQLSGVVLDYLNKADRRIILDKYYKEVYKKGMSHLTEEEYEYVIQKLKDENSLLLTHYNDRYRDGIKGIMLFNKSHLLEKLKQRFGKVYVERTGNDINDDDKFMYTMLTSNVLESIYTKAVYTSNDANSVITILHYFEDMKLDTEQIYKRIEEIKEKYTKAERNLYNFIITNKDNEAKLEEFLNAHGINKSNFSIYIRSRKFLDKKLKESALLILSKHYKTDYVSVYDLLEMMQEAKERNVSIDRVLKDNNINVKYFKDRFEKLKEEAPDIYNIIYESTENNININKKLFKYYLDIKSNRYNNYDLFIEKFKKTPEDVLELFVDTPLFNEIHEQLLTWYDFVPRDDKKTGSRK